MSRVLITSIGNPHRDDSSKHGESPKRSELSTYIPTTYFMMDENGQPTGQEYTSPYVFEALLHLEKIDKLILIGTAGSNWKALYEHLLTEEPAEGKGPLRRKELRLDETSMQYLDELDELCDQNKPIKHTLPADEVEGKLKKLGQSFNPKYHVQIIIMRYGLSDADWDENLNVLRRIEDILKDGDELYLDVTHSFRSLPIFQLLSVFYLMNMSKKQAVKLKMLSYGMREVKDEFGGKAPIINLRRLYNLMEYIKVAGEYRRFGTTYGLAALADSGELVPGLSPRQSKLIRNLGDMITINDMESFKKLVTECEVILNKPENSGELWLLTRAICQDIHDYFGEGISDSIMTQFNLAKWHMEKKRYLNAVTTAREACVSFAMLLCNEKNDTYDLREGYNKLYARMTHLDGLDAITKGFIFLYSDLRNVRNMLAHPTAGFSADERKSLVNILLIDELRNNDWDNARNVLDRCWKMREPQATLCLRNLKREHGQRLRESLDCRTSIKDELATSLPDPFEAVIAALQKVINKLHDYYRSYYFDTDDNAGAANNRDNLKNKLQLLHE